MACYSSIAPFIGTPAENSSRRGGPANVKLELANMIVHDLKGPLAEIMANLQLFCDLPLDPYYRECLDAAFFGAETLHRMIIDILDVARLEEGKLIPNAEAISLADLAEAAARALNKLALQRPVQVKIEIRGDSATVIADSALISRLIMNLLLNAIEHAPEESAVKIIIEGDPHWVELSVVDNGPGIPDEILPTIFDKYVSWTRKGSGKRHGTGLGLCFSKMAVEAHGGQIFVESKPGAGSKFTFRLPAKPKTAAVLGSTNCADPKLSR